MPDITPEKTPEEQTREVIIETLMRALQMAKEGQLDEVIIIGARSDGNIHLASSELTIRTRRLGMVELAKQAMVLGWFQSDAEEGR
jgi:hypothetical protein